MTISRAGTYAVGPPEEHRADSTDGRSKVAERFTPEEWASTAAELAGGDGADRAKLQPAAVRSRL